MFGKASILTHFRLPHPLHRLMVRVGIPYVILDHIPNEFESPPGSTGYTQHGVVCLSSYLFTEMSAAYLVGATIHEVSHYLVADAGQRKLINFGLGRPPDADRQEYTACSLDMYLIMRLFGYVYASEWAEEINVDINEELLKAYRLVDLIPESVLRLLDEIEFSGFPISAPRDRIYVSDEEVDISDGYVVLGGHRIPLKKSDLSARFQAVPYIVGWATGLP